MTWFFKAIRGLFGLIDGIIFAAIGQVFQLIFDLSNIEIFTGTTINEFASRIYVILGLVMVFKLMISFIQIIVNPDKMDDKEKGVGNVLGRVVISIALIVFVPSIFSLARQLQNYVIPVIPRVLIGKNLSANGEVGIDDGNIELISERMAFYTFLPFFDYDNPSCNDGSIMGTGSENNVSIFNVKSAIKASTETDNCSTDDHKFKYDYRFLLSTLVGGYVLFVIIQIAVAVAIRAIKLTVCEFVAPIPIASYIDPKTSKQTFDKWVSTSLKTYTDLFIRLILVYFMIFVFDVIVDNEFIATITRKVGGDTFRTALVILFLIVGLLQFVKTAPKFLSDLLGFKEGGDLMGMFKGDGIRDLKNSLGGLYGMAAAPVSSAMANYKFARRKGETQAHALLRATRGLGSGFAGATKAAINGEGYEGAYTKTKQAVTSANIRSVIGAANRRRDKANYKTAKAQYVADSATYATQTATLAQLHTDYEAAEQRADDSWRKYLDAKKHGDTSAMMMHKNNYDNAKTTMNLLQRNIDAIGTPSMPVEPVRPSSYGLGKIDAAVKNFTGTPLPTSSTYTKAAGYMNDAKKLFNDAKSKVTEAPTLITESLSFKDKSGNTYGSGSFATIHQALNMARNSSSQTANLNGQNLSVSELETIYGEALKDASVIYMDKVVSGEITNNVLKRGIEASEDHLNNDLILSRADAERVSNKRKNSSIGNFYKSADDFAGDFNNIAQDLSRSENNEES